MPTTCLAALIKRLRGIWERYRLRAEAAQNRWDDGHGRVYAWGQGKKRLRPRKGIEGTQKKFGRTDSRVTVEAAPRARTTDFGKGGVAADIFGHRAHKVGYGKVGKAMRQGMIQKIYC